ncbi:ASPIC/UnbV domain-containing protein [Kiritimatiella glycovorans]|uniref:ASPIC/UnbV domain-containing protein n=1 Tax=Kiritimatiella glycovorans TaxID=1307763 RepID=UPI0009E3370A
MRNVSRWRLRPAIRVAINCAEVRCARHDDAFRDDPVGLCDVPGTGRRGPDGSGGWGGAAANTQDDQAGDAEGALACSDLCEPNRQRQPLDPVARGGRPACATETLYVPGTQTILGHDEVCTDFCYRSKRSPVLHFGLGTTDRIDVLVTTRTGAEQRFRGVPADKSHTLEISTP